MDLWLVILPTGRIARHLLVGLHIADLVQSTVLRLPACSGIRSARRRFDILLLGHFPLYRAIFQRDNTIGHQRYQSVFQQDDHVVSRTP